MSNPLTPEVLTIPLTPHSPNSHLPILVYRNALGESQRNADGIRAAISEEWASGGHWKIELNGAAHTPHFHSNTHECYAVARGSGTYLLGKSPIDPDVDLEGRETGVTLTVGAGDVFVYPAGVSHMVTTCEGDYEILGFYSLSGLNSKENPWDTHDPVHSVEETEKFREQCGKVRVPDNDPLYGQEGPLPGIWSGY